MLQCFSIDLRDSDFLIRQNFGSKIVGAQNLFLFSNKIYDFLHPLVCIDKQLKLK